MADLQPGPGEAVTWCDACRAWHEDATPYRADPTPLVPGCTGKRRHETAHGALCAARNTNVKKRAPLYPYACRHCGGWHLSKIRPGRFAAEKIVRDVNA